jgi:antitoxin VapB
MAITIRNGKVERLVQELAQMTGESKTTVIQRALEERKETLGAQREGKPQLAQALDFLEKEVWAHIPENLLGRGIAKREREQILGYGRGGV